MSRVDADVAGGGGGPIPVLREDDAAGWIRELEHRSPEDAFEAAREIVDRVREEGDAALLRLTERYDGVRPDPVRVPPERCREALEQLPDPTREAMERAARNVRRFHAAQRRQEAPVEVEPGVTAWREFRPVDRVGIYAPGGQAPYPSSLLMSAVPARVAGCREVVATSPPGSDGLPAAPVMAAAAFLELDALYAVGGAQAVAALAYGTESVPAVDKIFGPGSRWVDAAKLAVFRDVAIDLPAGPSEVAVWADASADPELVAAELLAQAEHGSDSVAVAVLPEGELAGEVREALARRLRATPRRDVAAGSLADSALLVTDDPDRALEWVNALATEHLVVLREDAREALGGVRHAGSVFLGPHTPVAAGDYASGTNHVLPTRFRSRATGGLSLDDFGKWMQVQEMDESGLRSLGPAIVELAEWEGLSAHAESVLTRLEGS
jgi:histidinol dehydrogenase